MTSPDLCAGFRKGRPDVLATQECSGQPELERTDLESFAGCGGETRLTRADPGFWQLRPDFVGLRDCRQPPPTTTHRQAMADAKGKRS
jgi:hypothetical protein